MAEEDGEVTGEASRRGKMSSSDGQGCLSLEATKVMIDGSKN